MHASSRGESPKADCLADGPCQRVASLQDQTSRAAPWPRRRGPRRWQGHSPGPSCPPAGAWTLRMILEM